MDREGADFSRVFDEIRDRLNARPVAIQIPVGEGPAHIENPFRGIIDLVKMGQNEVPIRFEAVDLGRVLQKGLDALAYPVTIQANVPADLPAVRGDELRLQQVINNIARTLLVPSKETTMVVDTDHDSQSVWLTVSSPETNFSSETLDVFSQDDALGAVTLPTGDWALFVSHDLIKRQGGSMDLENQAGGGARITLRLLRSGPDEA